MLNSFVVLNKTMGPPSVLLTRFCPLLRSTNKFIMSSPTICVKNRGYGGSSSGLFHPIGSVVPLTATRSMSTIPTRQLKPFSESLLSDSDEDVNDEEYVEKSDSGDDTNDDELVSDDLVHQFMNYIDQIVENKVHLLKTSGSVEGLENSRNYAKKTDDGLYVRIEMPGLSKEDVKVIVDKNFLVIKGKEKKEADIDEMNRMEYDVKVSLETELYKMKEIKAEVKDGVLKVMVPKLKDEERKDIVLVQVD